MDGGFGVWCTGLEACSKLATARPDSLKPGTLLGGA
jgi:hypothetical protein